MSDETFLNLRKFLAPEFIFGLGAYRHAVHYAKNFQARRLLIVTDPGIIEAGWIGKLLPSLKKEKIPYIIYSNVSPNPRDFEIMEGADVYLSNGCNVILAFGGGSVIDCAKGIGIVCTNKKHILTFEGVDRVSVPMPPLICIPTTGGTSADVSQFAIIRDSEGMRKIAVISKAVVPDISLISPETLTTMAPYLSACTGIDALVHAIEAFVSNANSPFTDMHALLAVKLIFQNLVASLKDPLNLQLRGKIMMGSLEAGLAFSNASLGIVHSTSHSLGGLLDLPHGECNAIMLPSVMDFNYDAAPERFAQLGEAMDIDCRKLTGTQVKREVLQKIASLKKDSGIFTTLGDKGIKTVDIPELAKNALKDPCTVTNPRKPKLRDLEVIYEEAL
ncbi:MAG: alcohol dehydrogenase-like regulatory protein ErcA [Bacteroidota bacterium]